MRNPQRPGRIPAHLTLRISAQFFELGAVDIYMFRLPNGAYTQAIPKGVVFFVCIHRRNNLRLILVSESVNSDYVFRQLKHSEPLTEGDGVLMQKKNGKGTIYFVDENDVIVSKTCTKCNEIKTLDCFAENKEGLGNRRAMCLACKTKDYASTKDYVVRNSKRVKLETREGVSGKECTSCGTWKALDDYHNDKKGLGGKESQCIVCRGEYGRSFRELHKEYETERTRNWRINNPEKEARRKQRRRAREKDLSDNFSKEQMDETFDYFGGCALSGEVANIHWDHAIPLATGQCGTTFGNMIPLRGDLNRSKNDANIFEWFASNKNRFEMSQDKFDRLIDWLASVNGMTTDDYRSFVYECFDNRRKEAI